MLNQQSANLFGKPVLKLLFTGCDVFVKLPFNCNYPGLYFNVETVAQNVADEKNCLFDIIAVYSG